MSYNIEEVHDALRLGNIESLRTCVQQGFNVNQPVCTCHGKESGLLTPLCCVVTNNGSSEMTKYLLEVGAAVNIQSGLHKNTPLQLACSEPNNFETIRILLDSGATCDIQDSQGHTALHIAAVEMRSELVELLLKSGSNPCIVDHSGRNPLHSVISRGPLNEEGLYTVKVFLDDGRIDVNAQDSYGYTALHLSAVNENKECVELLIDHGSDVTLKTTGGTTALSMLSRKMPEVLDLLVKRLDAGVMLHDLDPSDAKCQVRIDFAKLIPTSPQKSLKKLSADSNLRLRKETDLLTSLISTGNKQILTHPLIQTFLFLKWRRVRPLFLASFVFQVVLVALFTVFVIELYLIQCPYQRLPESHFLSKRSAGESQGFSWFRLTPTNTFPSPPPPPPIGPDIYKVDADVARTESDTSSYGGAAFAPIIPVDSSCRLTTSLNLVWILLMTLVVILAVQEVFQLIYSPWKYFKSLVNYTQWALICSILVSSWWQPAGNEDRVTLAYWQYPSAAWGILLAWALLLFQIGRFPTLSVYVEMLGKVAKNFGLFILAYSCLLMGFALAFCILFPDAPPFSSLPLAILKVFTIMVGDVAYEELLYNETRARDPIIFPITAHLLFAAFVVIMTIVLMNLLVGLAVSDIQGLQKGAKLKRLCNQTQLIARIESFLYWGKLSTIFKANCWTNLRSKFLILGAIKDKTGFIVRPNDIRDTSIPRDLKQAILQVLLTKMTAKRKQHWTTAGRKFPLKKSLSSVSAPANGKNDCESARIRTKYNRLIPEINDLLSRGDISNIHGRLERIETQIEKIVEKLSKIQTN